MSWMERLYKTYEAGMQLDLPDSDQLMPISHTLQNAHIKIIIDAQGSFKHAEVLEKTQIVLPATEQSAGRSSGEAPHPLADKIQYVAKDYPDFGGQKKAYFEGYLRNLYAWSNSIFTHPRVNAVKLYVEKGSVVKDLVEQKILFVDEKNRLLTSWPKDSEVEQPSIFKVLPKEGGNLDQGNAMVCWSVEIEGDPISDTWKDQLLQQSWINFDSLQTSAHGLCYITGKSTALATNHPAKLRHSGDKAKLVSSNDKSGFTFLGKFTDKTGSQAAAVGFEVTQKAHNALRWLIARQGFRNGDQVVLAWAISGRSVPQPLDDTYSILGTGFDEEINLQRRDEKKVDHSIDLGQSFAFALNKYMSGYSEKFHATDNVVIMGLDSATPGRMAITYYQELVPQQYIDQISRWHKDFAWYQRFKQDEITVWPISAPAPRSIWEAIYGSTISDSLKKNTIERILPCIIEARPFPTDLVNKAVQRACNRNAYKNDEQWLWEKHLGIACSLFKGFSKRNLINKKEYKMALEENNNSRDYLYGRLLAIAERIEEMAMIVAKEKVRSTHASRLMQRFSDHPFSTWKIIEEGINPYQQRLKNNIAPLESAYKRLLDDVCDKFEGDDFIRTRKLSGEYLLSYHQQRKWLRDHKLENSQWIPKGADEDSQIQTEGEE